MASSFGGTVKLTGETEYRRALKEITSSLKVLNSEMKVVSSAYDKNDKSTSRLAKENQVLNKRIDEQKKKVSTLTNALEAAKRETGEDSETTKKWQTQLNNAQAELNKLERTLEQNNQTIKENEQALRSDSEAVDGMSEGMEQGGNSALTMGGMIKANLISSAITAGLQMLADLARQVGQAFMDTYKQSLEFYGQYEQLEGGIQAMFGGYEKGSEQINKVMEKSRTAWKDLTMSQNEYFEEFNSAYPLVKASIDDENTAIETTNRLLTLESDLANTFGYDISQASNAVNWAMKGSFNYIDNLNIGIKGTKEGFLEAAHNCGYMVDSVDDLSSTDILDILEKQADKFGVLGRTAQEATDTIEGSTKMLKASWADLVAGFGNEKIDMGYLLNDFQEALGHFVDNVIPRLTQIAKGMAEALTTGFDVGDVAKGASMLMDNFVEALFTLLPAIVEAGIELVFGLTKGIADSVPKIIHSAVECVHSLVMTIANLLPTILLTGRKVLVELVNGIVAELPFLLESAPLLIADFLNKIAENMPQILATGAQLTKGLITGILKMIPTLRSSMPKLTRAMLTALKAGVGAIASVGKEIVRGIWKGISSNFNWIKGKIKSWCGSVINYFKNVLGIHSPSQVFADEIGKNLALGVGVGFTDAMRDVSAEMESAIPMSFDTSTNVSNKSIIDYGKIYGAMSNALRECGFTIVLNDREVGRGLRRMGVAFNG